MMGLRCVEPVLTRVIVGVLFESVELALLKMDCHRFLVYDYLIKAQALKALLLFPVVERGGGLRVVSHLIDLLYQ